MIRNILIRHNYHYALESLLRVFFPNDDIVNECAGKSPEISGRCVISEVLQSGEEITLLVIVNFNDYSDSAQCLIDAGADSKVCERRLSQLLFDLLTDYTGYIPKWGIQTGVRPSKLYRNRVKLMGSESAARNYLRNELLISEDKLNLTADVVSHEAGIIAGNRPDYVSVYISIPFCPTRCEYCSFISHSIGSARKLIPDYIDRLCREIEVTASFIKEHRLRLKTIYIGGGTPTTLEIPQLKSVLDCIETNFDMSDVSEFTVEAGRPDTLSEEKLAMIGETAVNRITVNPQSFNDAVLQNIGRNHTGKQAADSFLLAQKLGFDNINMDLIAGLPGDTLESFVTSVQTAAALGAQNITVHTLALKRSAYLVTRDNAKCNFGSLTSLMLDSAQSILRASGYYPYYMYRQSRSVGNLENVGWCKPGRECEYNVYMMEELHSIFGLGAGAVTRLKAPHSDYVQRVYNYKYPYEYIDDFSQILNRKKTIADFFAKFYD